MFNNDNDPYRYTESGLDNVYIHNLPVVTDDEGEETYGIPRIHELHRAIARFIVEKPSGMSGKELRFVRTEMGLTQAQLAKLVHKEPLTVGRWERGEFVIDENAETLIRLLVIEELNLESALSVAELSASSLPAAGERMIDIDGSDPDNYRPIAA